VSDIAAMGGCPDQLLVSVAAPPATDVESLYTGISDAAASDGAAVVGGDLSTAKQVVVSVTVVGHVPGDCPPVLRSGAKPGDVLFVTGPLGAAGAGLRLLRAPGARSVDGHLLEHLTNAHRRPVARIAEGCTAREAGATSMIDLSDGLASDVRRLAVASGVGVRLRDIPVAKGATAEEALSAGDDYELLFSAPEPDRVKRAFDAAGLRSPLIIGECSPDRHELTLEGDDLSAYGWQHPW
jgi:thiamine-monophosphate kinase